MTGPIGAIPPSSLPSDQAPAPLALLGRYRLAALPDHPCLATDIAAGRLSLLAQVKAPVGERIRLHLDEIGSLEGRVERHSREGFAVSPRLTARQRAQFDARLAWLEQRLRGEASERRQHRRIVPVHTAIRVRIGDGDSITTRLLDVSRSGAAIALVPQPPVGTVITVGTTPARVVRHFDGGFGIVFAQEIARHRFSEAVVL